MACSTWAPPGLAQVSPWGCHPQSIGPWPIHSCPYCGGSILPCLERICQPATLACIVLFFIVSLVYRSILPLSAREVCTLSLEDDADLSSSALTPCCLKCSLQLDLLRRHRLSPLSLLFLRWGGWLCPARLCFMHTYAHAQLSQTPGSHTLHMKIIRSKLPFFACLCLTWVPQDPGHPFPMCGSTSVLPGSPRGACLWASPRGSVSQVWGARLLLADCHKSSSTFQSLQLSAVPALCFLNRLLAKLGQRTSTASKVPGPNTGCRASSRTSASCLSPAFWVSGASHLHADSTWVSWASGWHFKGAERTDFARILASQLLII